MKQSAYEKARDQRVADEVDEPVDRALMCPASGCPLRWCVEGDRGRGCSAHYWAPAHEWPRITQRILDGIAHHARYAAAGRPPAEPMTPEQRRATATAVADFVASRAADPRAWARELQRRHDAGEALPAAKVDAYRRALRLDLAEG